MRNVLTYGPWPETHNCVWLRMRLYRYIWVCDCTGIYVSVTVHVCGCANAYASLAMGQDIAHSRLNSFNVVATCRISSILTRTCHLPPQMTQTSFQIKCQVDLAISSRLGSDANSTRDGKQSWQDPSRLDIGANVKSTWVQC